MPFDDICGCSTYLKKVSLVGIFHLPKKYDSRGQNSLGQITLLIPIYGGFFVPRANSGLVALLLPTGGQPWMDGWAVCGHAIDASCSDIYWQSL